MEHRCCLWLLRREKRGDSQINVAFFIGESVAGTMKWNMFKMIIKMLSQKIANLPKEGLDTLANCNNFGLWYIVYKFEVTDQFFIFGMNLRILQYLNFIRVLINIFKKRSSIVLFPSCFKFFIDKSQWKNEINFRGLKKKTLSWCVTNLNLFSCSSRNKTCSDFYKFFFETMELIILLMLQSILKTS